MAGLATRRRQGGALKKALNRPRNRPDEYENGPLPVPGRQGVMRSTPEAGTAPGARKLAIPRTHLQSGGWLISTHPLDRRPHCGSGPSMRALVRAPQAPLRWSSAEIAIED